MIIYLLTTFGKDISKPVLVANIRTNQSKRPKSSMKEQQLITYQGQTKSVGQWAAHIGISPNSMRKRLAKWPLSQALTKPREPFVPLSSRFITHQSETLSVADWARKTGLSRQLIRFRLEKGLPLEQVFASTKVQPFCTEVLTPPKPKPKLTEEDVRTIRSSEESAKILAQRYFIHISHVYNIKTKKRRGNVK